MPDKHTTYARPRRWATVVAVAAVLTLTGCGSDVLDDPYEEPSQSATADAAAVLATLPSLEDTEVQIQRAVEQLGDFVDTLVPPMGWNWIRDRSASSCHEPYADTDGELAYSRNYVAPGPIPDAVWPQVFEQAKTLAASVGATAYQIFHDDPGNHEVRFYSPEATFITVGSRTASAISSSTGCRLPQAKLAGADTSSQSPVTPNP